MKLYRMKQASEITGLHHHTLRELHKKGELVPAKISTGKTRYYSEEQLRKYTQGNNPKPKTSIGYCRVNTQKLTVFSCKLQGKRAKKSKELVRELKANN